MSNEDNSGGKIPFTNLFDKDKLTEAIMNVFTKEELNSATQSQLFSISNELLDKIADSNSPLSVPAKKTRFCKTIVLTQFVGSMDAIDWDTGKVDMSK